MFPASSARYGSAMMVEPAGGPSSSRDNDAALQDRCARLSRGQIEVLRLVNRHLSSKEIAAELGISSHTVDQRVRGAIKTLGVSRRSEAARMIDRYTQATGDAPDAPPQPPSAPAIERSQPFDQDQAATYQRLIHQAPDIDAKADQAQSEWAVSSQIRHADRTRGTGTGRLETEQSSLYFRSSLLPFSTSQQVRNTWGVGPRLAAIAMIAILSSFSAGMLLAGLESLSRLLLL
jgi:DNA-binding CsgD family transcriptional regulator